MRTFIAAVVFGFVLVGVVPQMMMGAAMRSENYLFGVVVVILLWCALLLHDIEVHLRAERKRQAALLGGDPK